MMKALGKILMYLYLYFVYPLPIPDTLPVNLTKWENKDYNWKS